MGTLWCTKIVIDRLTKPLISKKAPVAMTTHILGHDDYLLVKYPLQSLAHEGDVL